ncbi:unannotated protein [freshwater metagenome]|uniref:Unannotated protein n=1 Tax=freshwater metagenome TaxID=449393 RepID=A0A6J6ZUX1_9ZZZZ
MAEHGALSGRRVLDLSDGFAGALCTMILGDNGAAVRRPVIRGAAADEDRHEPPGARQWRRSTDEVLFDPGTLAAAVDDLLAEADVVLLSTGSRALAALGWSADGETAERLRATREHLVVCVIDALGDHPSFKAAPLHDGVVHAAAGRMFDNGVSFGKGRPAYVAAPLASYGASQSAAQGIIAGLLERDRSGRGQVVRTSLVRGLTIFDFWGPEGAPSGIGRPTSELGPTPAIGYAPAPTKDGRWLQWANWAPHLNRQQLQLLGLGEVLDDPAYANLSVLAPADAHALWERVLVATAERTADEWMTVLAETGAAGGDIMRTTIEGMDHPQIRFNGDVATYDDPELGPVDQLGPIAAMSGGAVPVGPRPWTRVDDARRAPVVPASVRPPLDGLVLLEAASMIATPIGSAILADLGVSVIKIEPIGGEPGRTLPFIKTLQGKESITVDIKAPEGREIVQQLAERADMFLHNYRPGVPEKLGIDDASLRARNPRLVYLYVGGYGKHGPCEKMPAYHPVAGAVCGNAARQAGHGALSNVPVDMAELKAASLHLSRANEGHPDPVTGALAATALLVGIAARDRAGIGAEMTTSMLCASAHLFSGDWIRYDGRPPIAEVDSELLGTDALDRLYETSEGWLFVGVDSTAAYQRLVAVVEKHCGSAGPLTEEKFSTVADRLANDDALVSALTEVFATDTADEWERLLLGAGVGAARADRGSFASFQQAEIASGRHALARRVSSPGRGEHWRASAVVDMRGVDELGGACVAGQHSRAILAELGYTPAQIESLIERGIVGEAGER